MSDSLVAVVADLVEAETSARASTETRAPSGGALIDVEGFRRGDPECFRAVLTHFGQVIRGVVASYTGEPDEQDELCQQVSFRLLTQRTRYQDWGPLRGWVTKLAHNCCRNWCAARSARESALGRYAQEVIPVEESDALLDDPTRLLNYQRFLEHLEHALAAIPARQAQAFRLVHIEERSLSHAARTMSVSVATVRSHVRHAREKLRELLWEARDVLS